VHGHVSMSSSLFRHVCIPPIMCKQLYGCNYQYMAGLPSMCRFPSGTPHRNSHGTPTNRMPEDPSQTGVHALWVMKLWAKLQSVLGMVMKKPPSGKSGGGGGSASDMDKRSMLADMELGEAGDGYPMMPVFQKPAAQDKDKNTATNIVRTESSEKESGHVDGHGHHRPAWARHTHGDAHHASTAGNFASSNGASHAVPPHGNAGGTSSSWGAGAGTLQAGGHAHAGAAPGGGRKWQSTMDELLGEIDDI
jgi:hypothetical protein